MTDRELFEKALEAIDHLYRTGDTQVFDLCYAPELIPALRERLAQPEQQPVAWANKDDLQNFDMRVRSNCDLMHTVPLYTAPPQRKPLTDEEIEACRQQGYDHSGLSASFDFVKAARAIEAKLKEKNT